MTNAELLELCNCWKTRPECFEFDDESIDALTTALPRLIAENEALHVLTVADAEGLARVCMSFQTEMVHKMDEVGARVWREQGIRLTKFAASLKEQTP